MSKIWEDTWQFLWVHRMKMLQFVAIYLVTYLLFVKGVSGLTFDTAGLKEELSEVTDGNIGAFFTFVSVYWSLITSTSIAVDEVANFIQGAVIIIFSLAFIWLVRKLHVRNSDATVKQAFYKGMRPLIPFLAIIGVLILELIPAGAGSLLYVTAQAATVNATELELLGITVIMLLGIVLSIYLLSGSIFALYIVTLPDMAPVQALRSSMNLLKLHRWIILRRIIAFYTILLILGFILVLPFVIWVPRFAEIAFFALSSASFAVMHTFIYKLYRSLL